jgi:hypothetical protein
VCPWQQRRQAFALALRAIHKADLGTLHSEGPHHEFADPRGAPGNQYGLALEVGINGVFTTHKRMPRSISLILFYETGVKGYKFAVTTTKYRY